jgi:Protein of unknown function (DUF3788)
MEKPCLNDKDEYPSDEVLSRCLGEVKDTWDLFMQLITERYPSFGGEWRYYRDGSSWLYKLAKKKKTICWVCVYPHRFKATFYFPDRAEEFISASKLKREYVDQFLRGRKYGKIRGVTVAVQRPTDLNTAKMLIDIKEQLK